MSQIPQLLKTLVNGEDKPNDKLGEATEKAPIESKLGSADYVAATGGGGGRTEPDAGTRTYYGEQIVPTTDGVFTWAVQPITTVNFVAEDGSDAPDTYAEKIY